MKKIWGGGDYKWLTLNMMDNLNEMHIWAFQVDVIILSNETRWVNCNVVLLTGRSHLTSWKIASYFIGLPNLFIYYINALSRVIAFLKKIFDLWNVGNAARLSEYYQLFFCLLLRVQLILTDVLLCYWYNMTSLFRWTE